MFRKGKKRRDPMGELNSLRLASVREAEDQGVIGALARTSWVVHVLLVILAGLIQWSIWRSVEAEERVEFVSLEVKLDGDALLPNSAARMSSEFALVPGQTFSNPTIVLSGPRNEILTYRDQLERAEDKGTPSFTLLISPKDLAVAEAVDEYVSEITMQLDDFRIRDTLKPSDEVRFTFANPTQEIRIRLEKRVQMPALFVPETIKTPDGFKPEYDVETEGVVRAPWSVISTAERKDGKVKVRVASPDFAREWEAEGLNEAQRSAEWQKLVKSSGDASEAPGGQRRKLPIIRLDGMSYFDLEGNTLPDVTANIWLRQVGSHEQVSLQNVAFDYVLPGWLMKHMPTLEISMGQGLLASDLVTIEVLPEQRQFVNKENVRLVLDLRSIDEDDFPRDERPGADPNSRSRTFSQFKIRLEVNRNLITSYKFPNPSANAEAYTTRDVTITYTDSGD